MARQQRMNSTQDYPTHPVPSPTWGISEQPGRRCSPLVRPTAPPGRSAAVSAGLWCFFLCTLKSFAMEYRPFSAASPRQAVTAPPPGF